MVVPSSNNVATVLGTIGGILLGIGLIPQVLLILKRRTAEDVSYRFMMIHASGLVFFIAYLMMNHAIVGYLFSFLELTLTLSVIGLKFYYSNVYVEPIPVTGDEFEAVKHIAFDYVLPVGAMFDGANTSVDSLLKHVIYSAGTSCRLKSHIKEGYLTDRAYFVSAFLENSRMNVFLTAKLFKETRLLSIDVEVLPLVAESEAEQSHAIEELCWQLGDEMWKLGLKAQEKGLDPENCRPTLHNRQKILRYEGGVGRSILRPDKSDQNLLQMVEIEARGF